VATGASDPSPPRRTLRGRLADRRSTRYLASEVARLADLDVRDTDELVDIHFRSFVGYDHQGTAPGFRLALRRLAGRPARIVETGTSAWGVDSTLLFDSYVRHFGGRLDSVDLRSLPSDRLRPVVGPSTHLHVGDSVALLSGLEAEAGPGPVDLVYLDSYDLDWADPAPSEAHVVSEWEAMRAGAAPGTMVLIDDTPLDVNWVPRQDLVVQATAHLEATGAMPGKGARLLRELADDPSVEVLWHGYNVLLRIHA
jgi:hypothetical protein